MHGYLQDRESGDNPIDVARVVVVARVAVVVHVHEVSRVANVGRTLPPVVRNHPTAEQEQTAQNIVQNIT